MHCSSHDCHYIFLAVNYYCSKKFNVNDFAFVKPNIFLVIRITEITLLVYNPFNMFKPLCASIKMWQKYILLLKANLDNEPVNGFSDDAQTKKACNSLFLIQSLH